MTAFLMRVVPRAVRLALRRALGLARATPRLLAIWTSGRATERDPRVYYGLRHVPRPDHPVHGGNIKLQALDATFPNRPEGFNILYMVSSAAPPAPVWLARAARARGARVVWNQNGVAYPAWYGRGFERVNAPMARMNRLADHVLYQSHFCRRAADRWLGPREGSAEVLHNGVDTERFEPRRRPDGTAGDVLLAAGTINARYRIRTALEALARIRRVRPRARLLVAGRLAWLPGRRESERDLASMLAELQLGDAVECLGAFTPRDAPTVMARGDILLHTQYNDSCPGVVLEAMASGLPVVYSDSGGTPELVGPDAGAGVAAEPSWDHVQPPDPEALASAALAVAEEWSPRSEAARARAVDRFGLREWLRRHQALFTRLLEDA